MISCVGVDDSQAKHIADNVIVELWRLWNWWCCWCLPVLPSSGLPSQAFEYIHYNKGIEGEADYPYRAHVSWRVMRVGCMCTWTGRGEVTAGEEVLMWLCCMTKDCSSGSAVQGKHGGECSFELLKELASTVYHYLSHSGREMPVWPLQSQGYCGEILQYHNGAQSLSRWPMLAFKFDVDA